MSLHHAFGDKLEERKRSRRPDGADRSAAAASHRPILLVVDDEAEITRSIADLLGDEFEVLTANSAQDAIALLESRSVAVILTDQRMPGGNGSELLERALDIAPETTRILFTGYSDLTAVIDAVNAGQVYHYVSKPWRPDELRSVVGQGVERYRLVVENRHLLAELTESNARLEATNRSLLDSNRELGVAMRVKNDFLASMSHELRTPLNSIIGFSGTMLSGLAGDLTDEQLRQVKMVNNSGRRLLTLVEEVLQLARIDSGFGDPSFEELDMISLILESCELTRPAAEAKGLDLHFDCPKDAVQMRTDGRYVGRMLISLLDNAVKFTEAGEIRVTVRRDMTGVVIGVEDTGCGIGAEDVPHVFDDYFQGTPHGVAKHEGTGLGLAVAKRLAEALGATIEVASEVGKGSVFTVRVPASD